MFRLASLPAIVRKRFVLSQTSNPLQRPHPGAALRRRGRRTVLWSKSSSREVSRPYSVLESANRYGASAARSVPPERPPSPVFLRPSRVSSSLTPAALFHAAAAHGVLPFRAFPANRLYRARRPAIPSRRFPKLPKEFSRVLRGFCQPAVRVRLGSIASLGEPMLSWVFSFRGSLSLRAIPSHDGTSAHDLFRGSPSSSSPSRVFSVFIPKRPAFFALANAGRPSFFGLPLR